MRIGTAPNDYSLGSAMGISARGMSTERFRMDVVSSNIANANSTSANEATAYRRRGVVLQSGPDGPTIAALPQDMDTPLGRKQDWSNPLHDANGFVVVSNVNPVMEMVDMVGASRSYEANVAAFNSARGMLKSALNIGRN